MADVAEKLFELLFEQGARAGTFAFGTGTTLVQGVGAITNSMLQELLKHAKDEKEKQALMDLAGEVDAARMSEIGKRLGYATNTIRVADSDAKDYEDLLRQQDILYAKMNMGKDDGKVFVFLTKDTSKVQEATNVLYAMRGRVTEVPPNLYVKNLVPETVQTIDGLDPVETELFRHYARRENFLYTILPREDGKSHLVFDKKDGRKVRRALLNMSWDLTGQNGALYRKQVEYRLSGHNKIRYSLEEAEKELFVVSKNRPGDYVHVTENDYTLYKAGKAVSTVARTSPGFAERCIAACEGLSGGVVLEPEEFSPELTAEALQAKPTIDLHVHDFDEEIELSQISDIANMVQKAGLDDEHNNTWGISDPSVSYSEFSGMEFIMDTEEREARELEFEHFKKAAWYVNDNFISDEYQVNQKSIDFIIAKADARRRAAAVPVKEHQRTTTKQPDQPLL